MRGLVLILTARCNLACAYCYQAGRSSRPDMTWGVARLAIERLLAGGPARALLALTGGEPSLAEPLVRSCVTFARAGAPPGTDLTIAVATNGTRLPDDLVRFLAANEVELQVSYDGAGQELRAAGTGPPVEAGLRRLRALEPDWFARRARVALTLTPECLPSLAGSVEGILGLGVEDVSIAPATVAGWPPAAELEAELDRQLGRIAAACARFTGEGRAVPVALLREPAPRDLPDESEAWCAASSPDRVAVDPDGTVWGCASSAASMQRLSPPGREIAEVLRIGDVRDPGLDELLARLPLRARTSRLLTHRRAKRSGRAACASCPHLLVCTPCPVAAARSSGAADPDAVLDVTCALTRAAARARAALPHRPPLLALLRELEALSEALDGGGRSSSPRYRGTFVAT